MAMFKAHKVVSSLPGVLEADSVYFVRVGAGFDLHVTNGVGQITSYQLNSSGGGSVIKGTASITTNGRDVFETIAAPGTTPLSHVFVSLAHHDDTDENCPEMLDIVTLSANPGTDQIDVTATFSFPTSGPVKINYMVL
jgi:hypothetical protein